MKSTVSRFALSALMGLSLAACTLDADEASLGDGAESAGEALAAPPVSFTKFSFGSLSAGDQGPASNADIYEVSDWVLDNGVSATHQSALSSIQSAGKIPYIYFYIAAGLAKKALGINDCNVTDFDHSLCKWGGDYISKHVTEVVNGHASAAAKVQAIVGSKPALVHVEPDWYQYTETNPTGKPAVHPLGPTESGQILNQIISAIHTNCPSCSVVLDVSPWAGNLASYFSNVNMTGVQFMGLVGKAFPATTGKIDNYTYAQISSITGRKVIANTAHGPGGGPNAYDTTWDASATLNTMWSSGVAAVIQSNKDKAHYESVISSFRGSGGGSTGGGTGGGTTTPATFQFTVASTVNPWWIQVKVAPPAGATVKTVTAKVGSSTYNLTLQSYGEWAVSPSSAVPAGTTVVFTATDSQNHTGSFTSQPWPAS